ncbi:ABC transporter family protein [Ascodesmis nigricans]|uniref:ABC transporter family protein n=1 Tax=Ascodesmis nigricans TaxID=341454 RepID=A0A4S2MWL9_9PEZI|nr:ABC transporter family protein [Ascodesmis nigricans]
MSIYPDFAQVALRPQNHGADLVSATTAESAQSPAVILRSSAAAAFCGHPEGWGPLSPNGRADVTPCFLDSMIDVVSVALVITGAIQLYLYSRKKVYPVSKNWHYWTKLLLVGFLIASTFLLASFQYDSSPEWKADIRFWTPILSCVALAVAFAVHHYEHARVRVPSGVLLFYWAFYILIHGIQVRQIVSLKEYREFLPRLVVCCINLAIGIAVFALEWLVPKKWTHYSALEDDEHQCPMETATVFGALTFSWMTPLMKRGYKIFLTEDDLWDLRRRDTTHVAEHRFKKAWEQQLKNKKPSLWRAMFRAFGTPFALGAAFKVVQDILAFVQPQLLRILIAFIASYSTKGEEPQPLVVGLGIAGSMFVASVVQTLALHQYFQHAFETGMRIRSGLTAAIYRKSMKLSNEGRITKSTGDIVNLQAVDTQRLQDLFQYLNQVWSAPFQITLCMVSLYQLLGPSMFAGVAMMLIMIPVNGVIASYMKSLQKTQMKNKDSRTRLMTEILNNMKAIKLYAWGEPFKQKLDHVRNDQELFTLRKIGVASAYASFTWASTPFLVSCSTFAVYVLTTKKPLTTDIVFPALTLFNLLTFPLTMLPMVISSVVEAQVAVQRITSFLVADELQEHTVIREPAITQYGHETVRVTNGTFTWNKTDPTSNCLKNINFTVNKGSLSCIVGRVGSGKSSFLQAIVGELFKREGEVVIRGSVAYVGQQYFIMNASIRENILFGHRYDPQFYQLTIRACALLEDFDSLPDGDETQVGEKGISLSGGQKARVTLARAVYARADVYLLDDPLSAVDQHVGKHLIEHVLGRQGLLAGKTRIMATNSIPILQESDRITLIQNGEFVETGSYDAVVAAKGQIYNMIRHLKTAKQKDGDDSSSDEATVVGGAGSEQNSQYASSEEDEVPELTSAATPLETLKPRRSSLRRASAVSLNRDRRKIMDEEEGATRTTTAKEHQEQGKVKWSVYLEYARACNWWGVGLYMVCLVASQVASVGGSLWLKKWSEVNSREGHNPEVGKYIGVYFALGVGAAALTVVQSLVMWIFCAIRAAKKLHDKMAVSIFRSPMQFFETTPAGRILNRFSNDIYRIDEVLCRCFHMLFQNTAKSLATIVIICATTPPFIIVAIALSFLYGYIQRYYLRTSRELKRLDSVSKSPIYAHFQETLGGISTIRAYGHQTRFVKENEFRMDANLRAYYPSISANRWLAVRLEFIGSVIILGSAGFAAISVSSGSGLTAGAVGLAMSYALNITQSLNWIVRQTVEVETNIVSVERTLEYSSLPSEAPDIIPTNRPAQSWPKNGAIKYENYSTRYRPELDLVLKNINLTINPREKVGIVGRTGAGKSSLTLSLFRIIEPVQGTIEIDDIDTTKIGLTDLRSRIAIIPQDPSIFEGSIRDNLDPRHNHDDTELWNVLELAHLKNKVSSMDGQLDAVLHEGGSNLSVGEKALVSLARALLTTSNILVMDEATASLDPETDAALQETMKDIGSTVVTVAHRLRTVMEYDKVVVLERGEVRECASPWELLREEGGVFYGMCEASGELESYREVARKRFEERGRGAEA